MNKEENQKLVDDIVVTRGKGVRVVKSKKGAKEDLPLGAGHPMQYTDHVS